MATSSNRDVKMTLSVETLGQENIKTLQNAVASLAKEGGNAAPEFQQLADEIGRIGEQSQAIAAFKDLAIQTDDLATKQQEAATKASELAAKLALSGDASQVAAQKQKEASAALLNANTIYDGATAGIKNLNVEYDKAGKKTEDYKTKLIDLTFKQGEQSAKFAELEAAVKLATTALSKANAEQKTLTGQHTRADAALTKATQALNTHNKAVDESAQAAAKLGTSTENVAASEAALLQALNVSRTAALERTASMREMADADELVAIQAQGMAELLERGRVALIAEETAIREAARASADYASVRNAENAARKAAEDNWQKEAFAIVEATEAKNRNIAETRNLIEAQNFLIAQDADAKWLADAAAMTKANEASFNLRREKEKLTEVERQLATEIKQTGDAAQKVSADIANAFRTVGVRSAQELEAEIVQVRQAMAELKNSAGLTGSTLSTAFATGEAKIKGLERELRSVNGTLTMGDKTAKLFANSLGQISAGNVIADGVGYLVNKVKELAQGFLTVNLESQRLTKALTQVYGDAGKAGAQFDFLRDVTNKAGVSIRDVSDGFLRFSAATETSGIALEQSNAVFKSVTEAAGFLGLRGEQVTGVLEALGQMASKGTVSLEELRGQLGDRLPGSLGIAAKGMQMTQGELIKMIESGALATNVFFPAFQKGLEETFGTGTTKIEGFIQGWNRLLNAIIKTAQQASDSTAFTNMGKAFDFVAENIKAVTIGLELLAVRFGVIKAIEITTSFLGLGNAANKAATEIAKKAAAVELDTAATTLNTAATNLNSTAKTQNAAQWAALGTGVLATSTKVQTGTAAIEGSTLATRAATTAKAGLTAGIGLLGGAASRLTGLLGGPIGALIMFGVYAKDIGTWIGESAAKMLGWGAVLEKNEAQIKALAASEKKASEERAAQQAEQDLMNMKVAASAVAAVKQAELSVAASKEEVTAKEKKLKATQDLVNLQGPEATGLAALTAASQELTTAAQGELVAKQNLITKATEEIAAIKLTVGANGELTKAQKEQIAKLEETLKARQGEVEAQKETVRQHAIETAARRVASEALKDNSLRVDELSAAYENAKSKVEILKASGVASMSQIATAEIEAAAAMKVFTGAVDDSIKALDRKGRADTAVASTTLASANASKTHYEALAKEAAAQGDYGLQIYYTIEAKKAERAVIEASIAIKQLEIKIEREKIQAEMDGIKGTDAVAEAKRAELAIRLEILKAKQLEMGASADAVRAIDAEITALRNNGIAKGDNTKSSKDATGALGAETNARDRNTTALERENAAIERSNAAKEKSIELENKRKGVDDSGFAVGKDGKRIIGSVASQGTLYENAINYGLTKEQALAIAKEYVVNGVEGYGSTMQRTAGESTSSVIARHMEKLKLENASGVAEDVPGQTASARIKADKENATAKTYTVNISMGSTNTSINTSSDADAQALISLLQRAKLSA